MKIGLLREGKVPIDKRVPLIPSQCADLQRRFDCEVVVQPSEIRQIPDEEYVAHGIRLQEDLSDCDVLMGVKEVPVAELVPGKTYFFFSHTYKKQPYNAKLLRACVERNIRLIDYELLTKNGARVVAFGRFAGLVGAYNGLRAWGEATGEYSLLPAHQCHNLQEMFDQFQGVQWPADIRIVLTGKGRVASGAVETLRAAGIRELTPDEYLRDEDGGAVWTQLDVESYYRKKDGMPFDKQELYDDPRGFESNFMTYAKHTSLYIAGHYYDPRAPFIFTRSDARRPEFGVKIIADISCDIDGPVASTVRPSTISDPFYGYDPFQEGEVPFNSDGSIGVMAVDNLPCELSRDASESFGADLLMQVLPALFDGDKDGVLERATECADGQLTEKYAYLQTYIDSAQ
ncbi:MAG: hypothetical protein RL754_143 [Bacteroidota bacterium]|jgi:alanine dehydrogenase